MRYMRYKRYELSKEHSDELKNIFNDYIKKHLNEAMSDNGNVVLRKADDKLYDVTLYSCVDVAKNFVRIPTEYYCGNKVYPRNIGLLSDYSFYERECVKEILKEYDFAIVSKMVLDYFNEMEKGDVK